MTIEQLRAVHMVQPFRPFTIHLADGRSLFVSHREFLSQSQSGRTAIVSTPDDSHGIVDLLLVTSLVVGPQTAASNGQPPQ
jgi:hypothetical protein